jgi:Lysyl oxidase
LQTVKGGEMRGHRLGLVLVLSTIVVVLAVSGVMLPSAPAADGDLLPDLGMARVTDVKIDKSSDGRRLLRYSTEIANVGQGAFELNLHRATVNDPMTTAQRIYTSTGFRDVSTSPTLVFAGDGHNHWHVRDLETVELNRSDNGSKVGTDAKVGFCFLDHLRFRLALPGAPQDRVYGGCGGPTSLDVRMGLSVGWSDQYSWNLPDQYIDITGLTAGRYRLNVVADAGNWFVESNETNNATWVDIQLKGQGAPRILGYGPTV